LPLMIGMRLAALILPFGVCVCSTDIDDAGFEALLSEDDQCAAGGCTLNALQLHVEKPEPEVEDIQESDDDVCNTGIVAVMKRFAPTCIRSCPQMCQPLATAAHAFLAGGADAVDAVVCENQEELRCIFDNYGKCKRLMRLAGTVGLVIPKTYADMISKCSSSEEEEDTDGGSIAIGNEDSRACHRGLVGRLYNVAPECFEACSDMCGALQKTAIAMVFGGGVSAAQKVVCRYQDKFACPMEQENKKKCSPIVEKAKAFGVILPDSPEELAEQCASLD